LAHPKGPSERQPPGNTNPLATTSRTGSTGVRPLFISTALLGALGAPRDEELADVPSEEELVDGPSEEEPADDAFEDELADVPVEEELKLVDKASALGL